MKRILLINGCVRGEHSRTLKLARAYLEARKEQGDFELTERTLAEEPVRFLSGKSFDPATGLTRPVEETLAREFAAADEIVLAAPFWEFLFPAIVSCYFEAVSVTGITFRYSAEGSEGLCRADSFTYLYSAGNELQPQDKICEAYLRRLTALYGIPHFSAIAAEGLDVETNSPEEIVARVCRQIRENAESGKTEA